MKKVIRNILGYFGYDIIKVVPTPFFKKDCIVRVGKFDLIMPSYNPLRKTYKEQKNFASEISRLTVTVLKKYPDLVFLDIGANNGDTAARVKSVSDIPVISIEGDETSFRYLAENVKQFSGVTIINQFLGEREGFINADLEKKGWNTTIIPSEKSDTRIGIKTLDLVLKESTPVQGKLKILKIDTEGFDTIILRGAYEYIKESKPVIYLEYNRDNMSAINENGLETILNLEKFGYRKVLFFDDRGRYVLTTTLANKELINDLNRYADGKNGLIYYYNLCIFHSEDEDLAANTSETELTY